MYLPNNNVVISVEKKNNQYVSEWKFAEIYYKYILSIGN